MKTTITQDADRRCGRESRARAGKTRAGEADAFSQLVPMLASAQRMLPGSRILPGSYFNVPIAIGYAKGRPAQVGDYATRFAEDVKQSGFVQQWLIRAGDSVDAVVVHQPG